MACVTFALLLQSASAFSGARGAAPSTAQRRASVARSGEVRAVFAFSAGDSGRQRQERAKAALRDNLMHRSVELQVNAFAIVRDIAPKQYLAQRWQSFLDTKVPSGRLIDFLDVLQRSETENVFMPRRSFRKLSPGNPYAAQYNAEQGDYATVQPATVALRLNTCRESVAESWHEQIEDLGGAVSANSSCTSLSTNASQLAMPTEMSQLALPTDQQLLRGMATKVAVSDMLHDLSLMPSYSHVHNWLRTFLLEEHGNDMTKHGSVLRLHAGLTAQPIHIRGGQIVDPMCIDRELHARSDEVLEFMGEDLRDPGAHTRPNDVDFLDGCFIL